MMKNNIWNVFATEIKRLKLSFGELDVSQW